MARGKGGALCNNTPYRGWSKDTYQSAQWQQAGEFNWRFIEPLMMWQRKIRRLKRASGLFFPLILPVPRRRGPWDCHGHLSSLQLLCSEGSKVLGLCGCISLPQHRNRLVRDFSFKPCVWPTCLVMVTGSIKRNANKVHVPRMKMGWSPTVTLAVLPTESFIQCLFLLVLLYRQQATFGSAQSVGTQELSYVACKWQGR